ncbi:MAG: hypothetical protein Kow0047_08960 [Anaerolineae bacterium]
MTFALSTMWLQHRFDTVRDMAQVAEMIGIPAIEVSHVATPQHINGLKPGEARILSVHYPAPKTPSPYGRPADALLSSTDEEQRRWAVEEGRRCLEFAAEMGASAVCVHLGTVDMPSHLEWALEQRFLGGQQDTPEYRKLKDVIIATRAEQRIGPFDAARRSLDELAKIAQRLGIRIGIESRRHYREIPTWNEMAILLREHDPDVVGFWFDGGHVQILANLGFHRYQDWLDAYADRMVGVHLHDTRGLRDHLLPGLGEIDFRHLARYLSDSVVRTLELDWYYTPEELRRAVEDLRRAGCL